MTDPVPPAVQPSLGRRVMQAGGWSMAQVAVTYILRLGSNLIMTRLLLPEAFGLMAMVGVLMTGFTLFTDIGIHRSVAREPDGDTDHFLRAAWVVKIGRGLMIAAGVVVTAILLAWLGPIWAPPGSVYADSRLPLLTALTGIMPVLMGLESTTRELAGRNLKMQYLTAMEVGGQIITIVAMVAFAMINPTVWALLTGMLVGVAAKCAATHLFFPGPRMAFVWDKEIADRLWSYGKWLMGSSAFTFLMVNADRFILGALLSSAGFGIYVIAQFWVQAATQLIGRLSDQVGFPALSEVIRTRPDDVPRLYRKFQTVIDAICVAAFLFLFFGGQAMIDLLYTPTYAPAGSYLAIFSVGFLALRFNPHNGLIMNVGNSRAMMLISGIRAVTIWIALPVAFHFGGIFAALLVVSLTPLVTAPITIYLTYPILGKFQRLYDSLWFIATLMIGMGVYVYS